MTCLKLHMPALDLLYSDFNPGYGMETDLPALTIDLHLHVDKGYATLWLLLDPSSTFDTFDTIHSYWIGHRVLLLETSYHKRERSILWHSTECSFISHVF